jgi:DNA-binding NarL/FixJ family response regulator
VEGRRVIDPLIVDVPVGPRARISQSPLQQLTDRELQVLVLTAQGRTGAAGAAEAYLSESAISKHINSIFSKVGLAGRGPFATARRTPP